MQPTVTLAEKVAPDTVRVITPPTPTPKNKPPATCRRPSAGTPKDEPREAHRTKMKAKADRAAQLYALRQKQLQFVVPAYINTHTGLPHENLRENARRAA